MSINRVINRLSIVLLATACLCLVLSLTGCTSTGKSNPFALPKFKQSEPKDDRPQKVEDFIGGKRPDVF